MSDEATLRWALQVNSAILQAIAKLGKIDERASFKVGDTYYSVTIGEALDMANEALEP